MTNIEKALAILDLEPQEYFQTDPKSSNLYYFNERGELCSDDENFVPIRNLLDFLRGYQKVYKLPSFPEYKTEYFYINAWGNAYKTEFSMELTHLLNWKIGNFFPSKTEAMENADRIVKLLRTPNRYV